MKLAGWSQKRSRRVSKRKPRRFQPSLRAAAKPWSPEKSFEAYENGFALTNADCLDADMLGGPRFVPPEVVGRERAPAVKEKVIIDS